MHQLFFNQSVFVAHSWSRSAMPFAVFFASSLTNEIMSILKKKNKEIKRKYMKKKNIYFNVLKLSKERKIKRKNKHQFSIQNMDSGPIDRLKVQNVEKKWLFVQLWLYLDNLDPCFSRVRKTNTYFNLL